MTQRYETVQALLAVPERWTQLGYAMDANGAQVYSSSPAAVCWCLAGAVNHIYERSREWDRARDKLREVLSITSLTDWNDAPERTHQEVLEAVRKAGI